MNYISYSEMWYQMDKLDENRKAIPFSIVCSTSKGTFLKIDRCVKTALDIEHPERIRSSEARLSGSGNKNDLPQAFIRVTDLATGDIRTIYPRTIILFNGQK